MKMILLFAAVLAGCAVAPRGPQTAVQAGCSSGYASAGHPWYSFTKDTPRYLSDPTYKSDWDDGFVQCKGSYEATQRAAR